MSRVFEPATLCGIRLRNRIVRSATHEGLADERGAPTPALAALYRRLASGGAGLIITGEAAVMTNGRSAGHGSLMIHDDKLIPSYRRLVKAVHALDTPVVLQLQHCGRQTSSKATGEIPVAPSPLHDRFYRDDVPRELSGDEIQLVIECFAQAARRAREAGFDGVQLLAAHGYLLSQFLSRHTNHRNDRWGGALENRFRILGEIIRLCRRRLGAFPIMVKLNAYDGAPHGMRLDESIRVAVMLEEAGCDAIEVSCGIFEDGLNTARGRSIPVDAAFAFLSPYKDFSPPKKLLFRALAPLLIRRHRPFENYNVPAAAAVKRAVSIPVMVVGGITRLDDMEAILEGGAADFISMARAFVIEPDIVNRLRSGAQRESRCLKCNYCSIGLMVAPLRCYYGMIKRPPSP